MCICISKFGHQILRFLLEIGLCADGDGDGDGGCYGLHSGGREIERGYDSCGRYLIR